MCYTQFSMDKTKWLTIEEVRKITGLSRMTILRYIEKGILDKRQAGKQTKIYIDYLSIPTFLREKGGEKYDSTQIS